MIFWTSSEVYETGFGFIGYLSNADVKRFIKDKVVMPLNVTSCAIPGGIFKDTNVLAIQLIAYGSELNLVQPPMPDDLKEREKWNPIWAAEIYRYYNASRDGTARYPKQSHRKGRG